MCLPTMLKDKMPYSLLIHVDMKGRTIFWNIQLESARGGTGDKVCTCERCEHALNILLPLRARTIIAIINNSRYRSFSVLLAFDQAFDKLINHF